MSGPLVSIIIPAFNYERHVARAIESALAQDYTLLEVVVVDDGSTDRTAAVASAFESRGVRVIRQPNQGLAAARNTGIQNSSGELLFFLDADDYMVTDTVSRLVRKIEGLGPEFGMVACLAMVEGPDGVVQSPERTGGSQRTGGEVSWGDLVLSTRFPCTVLARRAVFEICGLFDRAYHRLGCEDRDMWIRIAAARRILLVPERLVTVVFHGANMSSDPTRQLAGIRRCLIRAVREPMIPLWRIDFWLQVAAAYHYTAAVTRSGAGHCWHALGNAVASCLCYPAPGLHRRLARPRWFRARKLANLTIQCLRSAARQTH